ncbi:hypothetical protein FOB72_18215 (plasmid) [Cupriavidus pauculus]|jgi:hypothetical protein|uniref:Uncharacterized protein n=1 Tax=Cupriavidus pauculus TaxID=82633 RepID=A0A5P2H9D1_9BURK|nr:hypothetical protein [Cupriavidus pauculus]QET04083.1 hypothetical protein FOB72_18215 [Cupriavidus pauculus]
MSLATLHTDAHRRLTTFRGYPARLATRVATGVAVRVFRLNPAAAVDMHAWHTRADQVDVPPPDDLVSDGRALSFALIGIATKRPLFLIGALAALAALPFLILSKLL